MNSSELKDNLYVGFHYKKNVRIKKSKLAKMGGNLNRVLNSSVPITRGFYKKAAKMVELPLLDEFCIEKIKSTELLDFNGFVYDMTVPITHNFLIETGFVSSNCHNFGELAGCGAHMKELRRTKAGPLNESSLCTLYELKDAYVFWKEKKYDKLLRKYILPVEKAVEHLKKIWVLDSAIKPASHGRNIYAEQVAKLDDDIEKKDRIAVMTLKGELLALGNAYMSSQEILKQEKVPAVDVDKVFNQQ
jgi:H/ACA ribonucleoprotein complex subunit 4